jgi:hypothetical protein
MGMPAMFVVHVTVMIVGVIMPVVIMRMIVMGIKM